MQREHILHALDLATMQNWDDAKRLLETLDNPVAGRLFLLVTELEQREEAQARGITTVRHEIGNALAIAQANLEGITDGVLPATPERLSGMLASLESAGILLDDLRELPQESHERVVVLETFNLCAFIGAHAAAIAGLASAKNVSLIYDPCGTEQSSCSYYRGDAARVGQILRNVLINAVRYTPPGGSIEIHCAKEGPDVRLIVRDSGVGISDEDLPHVFEAGYRGRNTDAIGSGIGLSVVQSLVKALDGAVHVGSHESGGAEFTVTLPAIPLSH